MPELPEVETIVRQLGEALPGHRIHDLEVVHGDLLREPAESFRRNLSGLAIQSVSRRGKNIVLSLSGPSFLVVNLGMTGQLLFQPGPTGASTSQAADPPSHLAIRLTLEPQATLFYADTRRFGSLRRYTHEEWQAESTRLGPEPFDSELTVKAFHRSLARSRSPLRSWLLDQRRIAGIGNIYACEALFRAGVHPQAPARSMDPSASKRLLDAIREVLEDAIRARGTTLRDYRTASGETGGFGPSLLAYGREGRPCPRCNTPIVRIVFGNRSAFFCPECQPQV